MPSWLEYSNDASAEFKNNFAKAEARYEKADDAATYSIYVGGFIVMILGALSAADFNKSYNRAQGFAIIALPIVVYFINNICSRVMEKTETELRGLVATGKEQRYFKDSKSADTFLNTFFKRKRNYEEVKKTMEIKDAGEIRHNDFTGNTDEKVIIVHSHSSSPTS